MAGERRKKPRLGRGAAKLKPGGASDAVLLLGSNIGHRVRIIRDAVKALSLEAHVRAISPLYASRPHGRSRQPWFLNLAVRIETPLSPWELLALSKRLETGAGRLPTGRWGPRRLDVDIILMGDTAVSEQGLIVPHESMRSRRFCLAPVADIAPEAVVPPGEETVEQLLASCEDPLEVMRLCL
ncbi:MAG: 2-amino-4-hydroxy-6-hydroxymethyldihydropteridine diphosphokinase [Syntrophorhabdaceae bacterium]|nr:2-amino-4-hydroxy-6-hydroxymethyldihydropteridine diphosphokinase [Syntrophorhabdaceae bacterium]